VVVEEAARRLYAGPLLASSVLATVALVECADEATRASYLPRLADGSLVATLGVSLDRGPGSAPNSLAVKADGDDVRLSGELGYVLDAHVAGLFVVPVILDGRTDLVVLEAGAPGPEVTVLPGLDLTRRLCRVRFADTPARLAGTDVAPGLARTMTVAAIALGADQLGLMDRLVAMAVDYAGVRKQFGNHIGSFQAVQHLCADIFVAKESAAALVAASASAFADGDADAAELALITQAYCSEAAPQVAETSLHLHGGIGFTWEHDVHLYLRRAKVDEFLLGDSASYRASLAGELGLLATVGAP